MTAALAVSGQGPVVVPMAGHPTPVLARQPRAAASRPTGDPT